MPPETLLNSVVKALEAGHISAEEAVRAALCGRGELLALLDRSARRGCRRPTVRSIKQVPDAVANAAIRRIVKRLGRSHNVLCVHWGVARRHGRRTSDAGVIVRVRNKMSPAALRAGGRRQAPAHVIIRRRHRRYRIRVDVQAERSLATLHADFARPADHGVIRRDKQAIGALGAIVTGPNGQFAVTAGHVAGLVPVGGVADCVDDESGPFALGPVHVNRFNNGVDIAAIGPVNSVPPAALLDNTLVRDPTISDTHHRVRVILPDLPTPIESHIDDVNRTRGFSTPIGTIKMSGLTAITRVTVPGDSGAPVLDDDDQLVGFVIGADDVNTFLLPARRALDALEDSL